MNKEEVLRQSRKENRYMDEREKSFYHYSFSWGVIAMLSLAAIFGMASAIRGGSMSGYSAIFWSYWAASSIYQYKSLKNAKYLVLGIIGTLIVSWYTFQFFIGR
ncbi:MAG TPA: DUF6442 family protein [Syntrophomonadaceae bacterium]|nr:DUF6442 family protein [Syntrophomonadaceae bacterium]